MARRMGGEGVVRNLVFALVLAVAGTVVVLIALHQARNRRWPGVLAVFGVIAVLALALLYAAGQRP